jgi:hypothetical protein
MPVNDPLVQKSIDDIVYQILLGKVIPIIGYDLLHSQFDDSLTDDFLKRMIKIHAKEESNNLNLDNSKTGYELINDYYHSLQNNETFKLKLSKTIQKERINLQLIPESYRKLVSIKDFKLFINATFTNSLELALNAYRAEGKTEEEIKSAYQVYNYHPTEPTDLPEEAPHKNFLVNFECPVIYNLFGTHDDRRGDYVLTDADYIELIYDLIENKQQKFTNLLSFLNGGYLLFLGCNFPDWFFRFFVRLSVQERLDRSSTTSRKSVIDSLTDPSRSVFISQYKIQSVGIDCNSLVDEIFKRLQREKSAILETEDSGNSKIFISYCRKDEDVAKAIAAQFDEKYIDYFLDSNDLDVGNNLNNKITNAIDRCCLFLPVVSANIGVASPYIWLEWKYAIDGKKETWPFFKDFVEQAMLLPESYGVSAELRNKILDKNNTLGIKPDEGTSSIPDEILNTIKMRQYYSRVSGIKNKIKD